MRSLDQLQTDMAYNRYIRDREEIDELLALSNKSLVVISFDKFGVNQDVRGDLSYMGDGLYSLDLGVSWKKIRFKKEFVYAVGKSLTHGVYTFYIN